MTVSTNLTSKSRLDALAETCLVNSPPEDSFDRYTRLCAAILEVPIALIVLVEVDTVFLKSRWTHPQTPVPRRTGSNTQTFCRDVVIDQKTFVVDNCGTDPRTKDSAAVNQYHIRSYAGLPVRTPENEIIGTFCAMDYQPRTWTGRDLAHLEDLRNGIESEVALRLQVLRLDRSAAEISRRLQAARQIFSNLSHEVRTPLNAVLNLSEECTELALPEPAHKLLREIHSGAQELADLLERKLDDSALESSEASLTVSRVVVRDLFAAYRPMMESHRSSLSLEIEISPATPTTLLLDQRRVSQLLAILVQYHLHRTSWSGHFLFKADWSKDGTLELVVGCDGHEALDNGEEKAWLFLSDHDELKAYGLSATLIHSLVELLKARLWGTSDAQGGVQLHLRFPAPKPTTPVTSLPDAQQHLRILAVDDDPTNLKVLKFLVKKLGHHLTTAENGRDGLDLLDANPYDALLIDLRMPGMDGFEVTRRVRRSLGKSFPIIAVTGDASNESRLLAQECGIDEFLTKPVKCAELGQAINAHAVPKRS